MSREWRISATYPPGMDEDGPDGSDYPCAVIDVIEDDGHVHEAAILVYTETAREDAEMIVDAKREDEIQRGLERDDS